MTRNELIKLICAREQGKKEVVVGNVREVLKIIVELELDFLNGKTDESVLETLREYIESKIK
jgi:hypothetical protein